MVPVQNDSSKIFIASVPKLLSNIQPIYEKLLYRRKIHNQLKSSILLPKYYSNIMDLHQSIFKVERSEIELRLLGHSGIINYCHQNSTLITIENDVIGVTLVLSKKNQKLAFIYAIIVSHFWHRTWATVSLKYHSLVRLISNGFEEIAFQAFEGNLDTLNYAQKVGGKLVQDNYVWHD